MGMKISTAQNNYEIIAYSKLQKQQLMPLWKKMFDHKERSCHKDAVKLAEAAQNKMLENICI
jgi:endonuclease I